MPLIDHLLLSRGYDFFFVVLLKHGRLQKIVMYLLRMIVLDSVPVKELSSIEY